MEFITSDERLNFKSITNEYNMIEGIPKISVLIIAYKQEDLIKRAIESLLLQKEYIYEICISDDCSPDNTWNVLQEYEKQYPGLFKLHRNECNVGIFENLEYTWTMPTGDVVYRLAGDDECGDNWLKTVVEFIEDKEIDYKNELFCIYGDYKCIYPNADSIISKCDAVEYNQNLFKLSLRGIIGNRSCCYSINILKQFRKVSQGRSHIAEDAQDRQLEIFSQNNYYIPCVGNIYYSYVGVSAHIDESILIERSRIRPYAIELFDSWGVELDEKDKIYSLKYFPIYERFLNKMSVKGFFQLVWYRIKAHDSSIKKSSCGMRELIFAIRRRLPHKTPIHYC